MQLVKTQHLSNALVLSEYFAAVHVYSQVDGKPPVAAAAAGSKSLKARQNEAVAAADAAATYSLRSVERGRVDPAAAAKTEGTAPPQKSALPADWGFLQ